MKLGLKRFWHDLSRRRYHFRQAVGGAFGVFLVAFASPALWSFAVGSALIVPGVMLRLWAAGHVRKNQYLETHGPYAFVRHPQYLGNCLLAAGFCFASGHVWAVAVWALVFYLFLHPRD